MQKTCSLADLESAMRACSLAVIQKRRGKGGPIFTLKELKSDVDALTALVARARAESTQRLDLQDLGDLLPRLAYWHQRDTGSPPINLGNGGGDGGCG